jgi:hypothetical protein
MLGRKILLEPKIALGEYKEIVPNEKVVMTWGYGVFNNQAINGASLLNYMLLSN